MFVEDVEIEVLIVLVLKLLMFYEYVNICIGECGKVNCDVVELLNVMVWLFYRLFFDGLMCVIDIMKFGLKGFYSDVVLFVVMGIIIGMFGVVMLYFMGKIFDDVILQVECGFFVQFVVVFLVMVFMIVVFDIVQVIVILCILGCMDYLIGVVFWDCFLNLLLIFFKKFLVGDFVDCVGGINVI